MVKKILIVDDDADIRFSVMDGIKILEPDWEVIEAENGQNALDTLKKSYVDLVILDIMMPVMDGWECASKIKEDPSLSHIPILFLTAKTDEYSKAMGKMNAADYIEKPFEITDLKERISNFI